MPVVNPGGASYVFWDTTEILNFARVLINDTQVSLAGQDLADGKPYTWTLLLLQYAVLENWLEDNNVESATYAEATLTIPANPGNGDPTAQSRVGYDGFQDAAGFFYQSPVLPAGMLEPLQMWSRTTGQNAPFMPMRQRLGGLGAQYAGGPYMDWEFRQNSVYFIGACNAPTDLRFRFIPSLPLLIQPTLALPTPPIIWFARAGEALAYMIAAQYLEIRNAANAPIMRAHADEQLRIIASKSAKRANQTQTRRQGYGFRRRGTRGGFKVMG